MPNKTLTTGEKTRIRNSIMRVVGFFLNLPHILIFLALICLLVATIDFVDIGLHKDWPGLPSGWFSQNKSEDYFSFVGSALLLMAFAAALLGNREARRDTSFELRPYLRIAWKSDQNLNDRQGQGIRNTCLVLVNNGNGLMRNVNYEILVGNSPIPVRSHSLITNDPVGTTVVYAMGYISSELGDRDIGGSNTESENDAIVKAMKIAIWGNYEDVDGNVFKFSFESDGTQQSWFKEMDFQHKQTPSRKVVTKALHYLWPVINWFYYT